MPIIKLRTHMCNLIYIILFIKILYIKIFKFINILTSSRDFMIDNLVTVAILSNL